MSDQNGNSVPPQSDSVAPETKPGDVVKYETYRGVLSEAKKLKEKVKEYEAHIAQSQEQKLVEQNEWKALAEQYKSKLDQTSSVLEEQERSIINGLKYHEFEKHLGGKLKNKDYATFIDFEKIILNPETKQVDTDSVKTVTSEFIKNHPGLVEFNLQGKLPNQAATNYSPGSKSISEMDSKELEKHILQLAALGKIK
jgi:hypothetical protein